jgi:hypothetical protein
MTVMTFVLGFSSVLTAKTLSLDDFLTQVKSGHDGIKATSELAEGFLLSANESKLLLSPTVFASGQYYNDQKETLISAFQGTKTVMEMASIGVSKMTDFGLMAKIYYNMTYTNVAGVNPDYVPVAYSWDLRPTIELSQSLWRNQFGRETSGALKISEAQAEANSLNQKFASKMTLLQAEVTYWRLEFAREVVALSKDTLARSEKIRN